MTALAHDRASVTVLHDGAVDASPPPGQGRQRPQVGLGQVLLSLSLLLTWVLAYLFVLSDFEQGHAQNRLYNTIRTELAEGTAPMSAPIAVGAPVAVLSIPSIGLDDQVVVEGTRPAQLQDGPGHLVGSVLPGQQGVSVVAGRAISFGAPFADLPEALSGASVLVTTGQGAFTYRVVGARRQGDPVPQPIAAGTSRLTLVTADRGAGGLSASDTVYLDTELVEGAVPAGRVAVTDPDTRLMSTGTDTTTLALLALSLQLLVGCLVGLQWAWVRWSRTAAWITGVPCVLAALWLVSSIGSRLLPGLV